MGTRHEDQPPEHWAGAASLDPTPVWKQYLLIGLGVLGALVRPRRRVLRPRGHRWGDGEQWQQVELNDCTDDPAAFSAATGAQPAPAAPAPAAPAPAGNRLASSRS